MVVVFDNAVPATATVYHLAVLPSPRLATKLATVGIVDAHKFCVLAVGADGVGLIVTVTSALLLSQPEELVCVV